MSDSKGFSLKSLFVKDDEEEKTTHDESQKDEAQSEPVQKTSTVSTVMSSSEQVAKFKAQMLDTLSKQASTGFDYSKFKQALNNIPSGTEQSKYEMVFGVAKTMNTTKEFLITTAKKSLQVVRDELVKLDASKNDIYKEKVTNVESNVESIKSKIGAKQEQVAALNKEIEQLQQEKQNSEMQVVEAKNKIEQKVQSYTQAATELMQEIERDVTNLTNYLK